VFEWYWKAIFFAIVVKALELDEESVW